MRDICILRSLLSFGLLMILLGLACKEAGLQSSVPNEDPNWLVVTRDGVWEKEVDVSGWEITEDVVELGDYPIFTYYPWQGEDSIEYSLDHNLLWVNGRLVGINLWSVEPEEIGDLEDILTVWGGVEDAERLEAFPNLLTAYFILEEGDNLEVLNTLPERVRLSVRCGDAELKHLAGFANLRGVDVFIDKGRGHELRHLRGLADLRILRVNSVPYSLGRLSLGEIATFKNLRVLEIDAVVDNTGVRNLAGLSKLRVLRLGVAKIGDKGFECLSHLSNIRELWLLNTLSSWRETFWDFLKGFEFKDLSDPDYLWEEFLDVFRPKPTRHGFCCLVRIPNLYSVRLAGFDISNSVSHELGNLASLRELYLYSSNVHIPELMHLERLSNLRKLYFFQVPVTDSDLVCLSRLSNIRYLGLQETRVSGEGLRYLTEFPCLENLSLSLNTLRDELGVIYLKELNGLKALDIKYFLTDTLLLNIASLTSLRKLDLSNSSVSKTVVDSLQKALPECKIMY